MKQVASHSLRRLFSFLKSVRHLAAFSAFLLVLKVAFEVSSVYLLSPLITQISGYFTTQETAGFLDWITGHTQSAEQLRKVLLAMVAVQIAMALLSYARTIADTRLSMGLVRNIRALMYDQLQRLAFAFYDRMTAGKLVSRALKDLDTIHSFLNTGFLVSLEILVSISAYLGLLAMRSPYLVVAVIAVIPVWSILLVQFARRGRPLYRRQSRSWDRVMTTVTENMAGKHVIKAFGTESQEVGKYTRATSTHLDRLYKVIRFHSRLTPMFGLIAMSSHIALFTLCSWLIQQGKLPVGDLMILGAAMATILGKMEQINGITEQFQRAMVSAERVFEVLDSGTELANNAPRTGLPSTLQGQVRFKDVSFGYNPSRPVLKNLNFEIEANRVTAIAGPTGSGKTTLTLMIARFYDPQVGEVSIDDIPVNRMGLRDLRQLVGFVFQETFLFTDSIRNNIRFGRMDVSDEMLMEAARTAHVDEFVRNLPQGYDTPLGDKGVQLSGGQRQRLALARALVYNPKILILDDATSAVDASTDSKIQRSLKSVFRDRTVVMITHRKANLEMSDSVLVLEDGLITQSGKHESLLAQKGFYSELIEQMEAQTKPDVFNEDFKPAEVLV